MRPTPPVLVLGFVLVFVLLAAACSGGGPADGSAPAPPTPPTAPAPAEGPTLEAVTPAEGPLEGRTRVRIEGSGFLDAQPTWVRFGDRLVEAVASDDTLLEVEAPPADAPGAVAVGVVTTRGRAARSEAYTYRAPSPLLAFTPAVGFHDDACGGTPITLVLQHHEPFDTPRVWFGGIASTSVEMVDVHTLVARVPPGLIGGSSVGVSVLDGWQITTHGFRAQGELAPGDLIVNEWMANAGTTDANRDGTPSAGGDEFVEIVNRLDVDVDLSHASLHDASALRHRFPCPTTVPARGAIVVFGFGNSRGFAPPHASGQAQVASTGNLGLNNGGDHILLLDPWGGVLCDVDYAGADVDPGVSSQNPVDGGALPDGTRGSDYVRHDEVAGAPASPGRRVDGSPFE